MVTPKRKESEAPLLVPTAPKGPKTGPSAVVVTGAGDSLELWDRAAWNSYNAELADRVNEITAALDHPV